MSVALKCALLLYGSHRKASGELFTTLDELHHFFVTTKDKPAEKLPPTDDAYKHHTMHSFYQTTIWCHSHIPKPKLIQPTDSGWKMNDKKELEPIMFLKDPAPKDVRDMTHLYCADINCTVRARCQCVVAGLSCIDLCSCSAACQNYIQM